MTIECSHCGMPFVPDSDRAVVACDFCGHRTFNPYFGDDDDWGEDDDEQPAARVEGARQ